MLFHDFSDDAPPPMSWLGLYSGIMTILLTFFLVLFCTGRVRQGEVKFEELKRSVATALGSPRYIGKEPPPPPAAVSSVPMSEFERLVMGPGVTMYRIRNGMAVAVPASFLFMPDGLTPSTSSREILDKVVAYARCGSTRIAVECCAMNARKSSTAWDASLRRAMAIGNYLIAKGVAANRICPIGMGRTAETLEQDAGNNVIISFYYE